MQAAGPSTAVRRLGNAISIHATNVSQERFLAERTGVHRLKTWAAATPASSSVYADKVGGATDLDTLPRTLEHDDQYVCPSSHFGSLMLRQEANCVCACRCRQSGSPQGLWCTNHPPTV